MKKIFAHVAFALGFAPLAFAASVNTPYGPFLGVDGGTLNAGSGLQLGKSPLAQVCSEILLAKVDGADIKVGDAVELTGNLNTGYKNTNPVQVCVNAASENFLGIAVSAGSDKQIIQVCASGVVRAYCPGGAQTGWRFDTDTTAGALAHTTTTPGVFRALQDTSADYVIGQVFSH